MLRALKTIITHPVNRGHLLRALAVTIWWKCNQLFFHLPCIKEIAPGVKILCYPESSYGSFIIYATWPEYAELRFIYSFLEKHDTYIDVGAHIGDSSLLAAAKITDGKIIACEPTPAVFSQLQANIKLNNFESKIIPLPEAVSNKAGTAFFALESASEVNHLQLKRGRGKNIKVKTTTIDVIIKKYKLNKVTILKIDVEGFEWEVLKGANKSTEKQKIELIIFEVNPTSKSVKKKLMMIEKTFKHHHYKLYSFTKNNRLVPVTQLTIPRHTSNFVAVSSVAAEGRKFKSWLK